MIPHFTSRNTNTSKQLRYLVWFSLLMACQPVMSYLIPKFDSFLNIQLWSKLFVFSMFYCNHFLKQYINSLKNMYYKNQRNLMWSRSGGSVPSLLIIPKWSLILHLEKMAKDTWGIWFGLFVYQHFNSLSVI